MKNGQAILTICDTPILLFWADDPGRLSAPASAAFALAYRAALITADENFRAIPNLRCIW